MKLQNLCPTLSTELGFEEESANNLAPIIKIECPSVGAVANKKTANIHEITHYCFHSKRLCPELRLQVNSVF